MVKFVLGIIVLLIATAVFLATRGSGSRAAKALGRLVAATLGLVSLLLLAFSMLKIVPANTVGIPVTFGKPGEPTGSGLHFFAPWTSIEKFSTRVQASQRLNSSAEGDILARDCVEVKAFDGSQECVEVTVRYTLDPSQAKDLYRRYGDFDRVNEVLIRRVTNDTMSVVFGRYTPEQAVSGSTLEEVRSDAREAMSKALDPFGITLDSISIGSVTFENPNVQARIDEKIAARQQAETAKIDQERRLIEAETAKKVAEEAAAQLLIAARAEAEANEIRSEALTPQVLQSQYYDALANADTLIVTGTDTPVILDAASMTTTSGAPTDDQ